MKQNSQYAQAIRVHNGFFDVCIFGIPVHYVKFHRIPFKKSKKFKYTLFFIMPNLPDAIQHMFGALAIFRAPVKVKTLELVLGVILENRTRYVWCSSFYRVTIHAIFLYEDIYWK